MTGRKLTEIRTNTVIYYLYYYVKKGFELEYNACIRHETWVKQFGQHPEQIGTVNQEKENATWNDARRACRSFEYLT